MSVIRFEFKVHEDKANAISAPSIINRGGRALTKSGLRGDCWKLQQTAPRKVLFDVINEPANIAAFRGRQGEQFILTKEGISSSTKTPHKIFCGTENIPININNEKQVFKSQSLHKGLTVLKDAEPHFSNAQSVVTRNKPQALPQPEPEINNENCESESIFPKSEHFSSYVSKLLTWRPSCLFGVLPDSESDNSDIEELTLDGILLDMPLFMPTVPEFSAHLINDFPPPESEYENPESSICQNDTEMSFDLTNDTSLSFGTLHFKHGSLDNSQIDESSYIF